VLDHRIGVGGVDARIKHRAALRLDHPDDLFGHFPAGARVLHVKALLLIVQRAQSLAVHS